MTQPLDVDLFGNSIHPNPDATPARAKPKPINDFHLIQRVLRIACTDGYAVLGDTQRVYRIRSRDSRGVHEITSVPSVEADAVRQLIATRDLTVGRQLTCAHPNRATEIVRAVVASRATRRKSVHWRALHRPANPGHGDSPTNGDVNTDGSDAAAA